MGEGYRSGGCAEAGFAGSPELPGEYLGTMPVPMAVARVNKAFTNRLMGPLAARIGGFCVIVHHGRSSGTRFETPVNVFDVEGGVVIALTYGPDVDWLKNVTAEGGCTIVRSGVELAYEAPRTVELSEFAGAIPGVVTRLLQVIGVREGLHLTAAPPS